LALEVCDTGSGIPESERERIFESFYQLDKDETGGLHSGLGLGLSIVRLLVQLMEGSISVSDKSGGGSIFTVLLPFIAAPPDTGTESAMTTTTAVLRDLSPDNRRGRSVLIVEDEAINRLYIQRMLEGEGLKTSGVGDGAAAVAAAGEEAFDMILMDMGLPLMSGLDATRIIRQAETATGRKRTPIAALTANAYPQDREECTKAGMDDFISKPFEEKAFWLVVDRLLGVSSAPSINQSVNPSINPSSDQD
jgi:CheY-like chemotaxis protein